VFRAPPYDIMQFGEILVVPGEEYKTVPSGIFEVSCGENVHKMVKFSLVQRALDSAV
jgi:hypothetical protein